MQLGGAKKVNFFTVSQVFVIFHILYGTESMYDSPSQ